MANICLSQGNYLELNAECGQQPFSEFPYRFQSNPNIFECNGRIYIGSGYNSGYVANDFSSFDPITGLWTRENLTPFSISLGAIAKTATQAFLFGGVTGEDLATNQSWKFDQPTGTWTQISPFPGVKRRDHFAFVIDSLIFVGGGRDYFLGPLTYYSDFWQYNINSNTWTQKANLPSTGACKSASDNLNGYLFLVGNSNQNNFKYDPLTDTWTTIAQYPETNPSAALKASYVNSQFYVQSDSAFAYDPISNNWNQKNNLPGGNLVSDLNYIYAINLYTAYKYDPVQDNFDTIFDIRKWYLSYSNNVYLNGKIYQSDCSFDISTNLWSEDTVTANLIFTYNGKGYGVKNNDLYEFDPVTELSILKDASAFSNIDIHYKVFLIDDNLFFLKQMTDSFWSYKLTTGQWTLKASFPGLVRDYPYGFSLIGNGYLYGGRDNTNTVLSDFWKYDPIADSWSQKNDIPGPVGFPLANDERAYVCYGHPDSYGPNGEVYEYNPYSDYWRHLTGNDNLPGASNGYVVNDDLYFGGGICCTANYSGVENYHQHYFYKYTPFNIKLNALSNTFVQCDSDSIELALSVIGGSAPVSFRWDPATGISNRFVLNPTISPNSNTTYTLTATDAIGDTAQFRINVVQGAGRTLNLGNDTTICFSDTLTLEVDSAFNLQTWQDGYTSVTREFYFQNDTIVRYSVSVIDNFGCQASDTIEVTFETCTEIGEVNTLDFLIYPNVVVANEAFKMKINHLGNFIFKIYDVTGKVCFESYANTSEMEVSPLSSGSYIYTFEFEGKRYSGKLLVQ